MGTFWLWTSFSAGILLLLAIELIFEARRSGPVRLAEAAIWSALWVLLSVLFGAFLWSSHGSGPGIEFFTGYIVEKSLSLDNLLVFVILFRQFSVPPASQQRVLLWGVLGALLMRGLLIAAGAALLTKFHWMLQLFGAFLLVAGIHLFLQRGPAPPAARNPVLRLARRIFPITESFHGRKFFFRRDSRLFATPLLLVLVAIETADLLFAADSVPAVFGVTRDPFLVFSSNACAVLGLRSLYFLLSGILPRLRYLSAGLSCVLLFIGARMIAAPWFAIPVTLSLVVIAAILSLTIALSLAAGPASAAPSAAPISNPGSGDPRP